MDGRARRAAAVGRERALAARVLSGSTLAVPWPAAAEVQAPPEAVLLRGALVAVLPFADRTGRDAGRMAAAFATTEMKRPGRFSVLEPWQVRERLAAAGHDDLGAAAAGNLLAACRLLGADAIMAGTVTRCVRAPASFGLEVRLVPASGGSDLLRIGALAEDPAGRCELRELARRTIAVLLDRVRPVEQ